MPLVGTFHGTFWALTDATFPSGARPATWSYPAWQTTTLALAIYAVPLPTRLRRALHRRWAQCVWWWQTWRAFARIQHGHDAEAQQVLWTVVRALEHPAYPLARASVRKTATTLGFNRPEAWKELGRAMKADPGSAENQYRHMEAVRLLRVNALGAPLGNPAANLLIELAYQGFAARWP